MFHPGRRCGPAESSVFFRRCRGGSMKKMGLAVLAFAGMMTIPAYSQAQSAPPQKAHAATLDVGESPTPADMYCSGFITTEKVPDKLFVAAGHNSPDQSRYAGASDTIFIHGAGMKEGDRYQIIRHVRDTNHYEIYSGKKTPIHNAGEPYFEMAIVKIIDVQKNTGIASFELS